MQKVIEVEDVSFTYGGEPVFSKIGFSVYPGDFVAMIGANGAGKSTLLKLLLGEIAPATGKASLFGQDIRHFKDWPKVGYMPQNALRMGADFPASVGEIVRANLFSQVGLCRFPSKAQRAKATRALEQVNMAAYEKRLIGELSGGQQQRVMLARVLVGEPQMMILDEPTTGVDADTITSLYTLLSQLNREQNLTIVMVTHDLARVADYATRVLCLEDGSMMELPQDQVQHELAHRHRHPDTYECCQAEGGHCGHPTV